MYYDDQGNRRTAVNADGTVAWTCDLQPSVLPMTAVDFDIYPKPIYLMALRNAKEGLVKGKVYRLKAITMEGRVILEHVSDQGTHWPAQHADDHRHFYVPGLYKMTDFAEMLEANIAFDRTGVEPKPAKK